MQQSLSRFILYIALLSATVAFVCTSGTDSTSFSTQYDEDSSWQRSQESMEVQRQQSDTKAAVLEDSTVDQYFEKDIPLTVTQPIRLCLTELLVEAQTGNLQDAGFTSADMFGQKHKIQLHLSDGSQLQGELASPAHTNEPYLCRLDIASDFNAGSKCVQKSDIQMVMLVSGGGDGWYVSSITTKVKDDAVQYTTLTVDNPFNVWLDSDDMYRYDYDATKHILSMGSEDRPRCDHGSATCTCDEAASTCIFDLEIDVIQTFTSYQMLKHDRDDPFSMIMRGTQGVSYFIRDDGEDVSHQLYNDRTCSKENFNKENCTTPHFVDGKTFREAIGVNSQIPGPTIIVHDQQMVVIHVRNNLTTEGISIHWHGMHQKGTPWMDGVGQVSHCQIVPSSTFSYVYKASPSGTFWYHSHSGIQRTEGFYGALIVKERPADLERIERILGLGAFEDNPGEHVISLLDWENEPGYGRLAASLGYFIGTHYGEVPDDSHEPYSHTRSPERAQVGNIPFFAALINGKGKHESVPYIKSRLSVFTVEQGKRYRFRLVGSQGLFALKFSIDGHKLIVVGTDGYWTQPVYTDYLIIHTGERYDFILEANQEVKEYWMRAETLEVDYKGEGPPYKSLGHTAEGILQYVYEGQTEVPIIPSTRYELIKDNSPPIVCSPESPCQAVNCPFQDFHPSYNIRCKNIDEMRLLEPTPPEELPNTYPCREENCQHFLNFNFEGDSITSAVDGRTFYLPPAPPQTQYDDFLEQVTECTDEHLACNPTGTNCFCTQVKKLADDETVQLILTSMGTVDNGHPIHIHGHTFTVVKVGYPDYDEDTGFIKQELGSDGEYHSVHNRDIKCADINCTHPDCIKYYCTEPSWAEEGGPSLYLDPYTIRKDTVMLPAGGYVVVNFISDNPGFWFVHCHIEPHQFQGMALILNEAYEEHRDELQPPPGMNKCGDFNMNVGEYRYITDKYQKSTHRSFKSFSHFENKNTLK